MEQREDFLGQTIAAGDYVLGSQLGRMTPQLFQIVEFTAKKVRVSRVGCGSVTVRTPTDLVKIEAQLITMFKLKQAK